ncbi:MAG TPA: JDVT-CTERM system glutamic-type intramembrane protease [Pseudomonadales bacterium]
MQQKQYIDNSLKKSLRDPLVVAALVAAPVFWLVLYFISPPIANRGWLLAAPLWYLKLVLLYPVLEELVFRGLVQSEIFRFLKNIKLGPISLANISASAVFSGFHLLNHGAVWAALVFIPSLLFGHLKEKYHSLKQPIFIHVYFNAGYFIIFPPVSIF